MIFCFERIARKCELDETGPHVVRQASQIRKSIDRLLDRDEVGNVTARLAPLVRCAVAGRPAHSRIGCRMQRPIRLRANVERASPEKANVTVPSDPPSMTPRQTKSIGPSRCSDR